MKISIDDMMVFVAVVEADSFTKAGEVLNMGKSRVSQIITNLENELNTKLLTRSTRKLSLTENGQEYFEKCLLIKELYEEANNDIQHKNCEFSGVIRLGAPIGFKPLTNVIVEFTKLYPNIEIELIENDGYSDLISERCELSIRIGDLKDSNMFALKLGEIKDVLCVAKDNDLKIDTIDDLISLDWVCHFCKYTGKKLKVYQEDNKKEYNIIKNPQIKVSSMYSLVDILENSDRFGVVPQEVFKNSDTLRQILPNYNAGSFPIQIVYNEKKLMPKKIRLFIDFIKENFKYN